MMTVYEVAGAPWGARIFDRDEQRPVLQPDPEE